MAGRPPPTPAYGGGRPLGKPGLHLACTRGRPPRGRPARPSRCRALLAAASRGRLARQRARLGRETLTTADPKLLRRRQGQAPRAARAMPPWPAGGTSPSRLASSWPPLWPRPGGHVRGARASARAHVWGSPLLRRCRCSHLQLWRLLRGGGGTRAEHGLLRCGPGKRASSTPSTAALTRPCGPSPQCSAPSCTDCCEDAVA